MPLNNIDYDIILPAWFYWVSTFAKTKKLDTTAVAIYFWRYLKNTSYTSILNFCLSKIKWNTFFGVVEQLLMGSVNAAKLLSNKYIYMHGRLTFDTYKRNI